MLIGGYLSATAVPLVRRAHVALPGYPAGAAPLKLVLMTDSHVADPDMPPSRLGRIVAQVNALGPDIVVLTGDYVSDKALATRLYRARDAIAPFAALRPRLGTVAVLGNHDHWRGANAVRTALHRAGAVVLTNDAVRLGPLTIGGADDSVTDHENMFRTRRAIERLGGPAIFIAHVPDLFPHIQPGVALMLAGHSHCGQIAPPLIGPIATASAYGRRFACGIVHRRGQTLIVGAGLGTSLLPLRVGAPPELWLVTVSR